MLCPAPQEETLGAAEGRQLSCRRSWGCSWTHPGAYPFTWRAGRAIASRVALGRQGKSKKSLLLLFLSLLFLMKRLVRDSITGAASPGAPVPSAVTPPAYGAERTSLGWSSPLHTHPVPSRPRRD